MRRIFSLRKRPESSKKEEEAVKDIKVEGGIKNKEGKKSEIPLEGKGPPSTTEETSLIVSKRQKEEEAVKPLKDEANREERVEKAEIEKKLVEKETASEELEDKGKATEPPQDIEKVEKKLKEEHPPEKGIEQETIQGEGAEGRPLRKPYTKKPPTEEGIKESKKHKVAEREKDTPEKEKTINLGDLQKSRPIYKKKKQREKKDREKDKEKEIRAAIVQSPFVEIDLDTAEVWLVLPRQEMKQDFSGGNASLIYEVEINGRPNKIESTTAVDKAGKAFLKEKRILLEEPLHRFSVKLPPEFKGRKFNYSQKISEFYPFIAVGDDRGRLFYLNKSDGNINPLPRRETWILLHEDFELKTEAEVVEEKWIWDRYKPFRVNLGEVGALIVESRKTGKKIELQSQNTFRIEGVEEKGLVEDDFTNECPLFTCKTLRILAPGENPDGWSVWVQNREAGSKFICKGWTGSDPLELKFPENIPCEFGEFQIDICQRNTRIASETLFFRLMPPMGLEYPKALIFPEAKSGHGPSLIKVKIFSEDEWELKKKGGEKFEFFDNNSFQFEVPPEEDICCFSASVAGRPESTVNFKVNIPRLKWKTSKQKEWQSKSLCIEKKDLKRGEPFYLLINTNDFDSKYEMRAVLEQNKIQRQEGSNFERKGSEYWFLLNTFYETIESSNMDLVMKIEIRRSREKQLLGSIEALYFKAEKVPKKEKPSEAREKKQIEPAFLEAFVKSSRGGSEKRAKGFSKREILSAGLKIRDVHTFNIPYDRRRKSSYARNINTLKKLKKI